MIALIQIADSMIQAPTGINVKPNLLQSLRLAPETVVEMHQQAIESFDRIKAT